MIPSNHILRHETNVWMIPKNILAIVCDQSKVNTMA